MAMKKNTPAMPQFNRRFDASIALLVIICIIAAGFGVHFLDSLYYDSRLLAASGQIVTAKNELGRSRYDIKFIINNSQQPINCYQLRSSYDQSLCYKHTN